MRDLTSQEPFKNIYYSSDGYSLFDWVYDEKNGIMYYVSDKGLYKSVRNGNSFSDGVLLRYGTDSSFENDFFAEFVDMNIVNWTTSELSYYNYSNYDTEYIKIIDDKGALIAENVVKYIVGIAGENSAEGVSITTDDVDVCFDCFKDIEGYEEIYTVTKGLKNEDAIKAFDTPKLRKLLYGIFDYNHGYYGYENNYKGASNYEHNFLADVLYVKGKDMLLCESSEPVNKETEVRGVAYFRKNGDYYENAGNIITNCFQNDWKHGFTSDSIRDDYKKSDGSVDAIKVLQYAFSRCFTHGEKEFRLDVFKDDSKYGMLYSDLKDEEALEWIADDEERLFWFGNALYAEWNGKEYISAYKFSDFFFIKGTNEPAWKEIKYSVSYAYDIKDYTVDSDGCLWGRYSNMNDSYSTDKYFYFVQITDSDGCLINDFKKVDLPDGKVAQTIENDGALYMKYALLNSSEEETGYHQIYKVNFSDNEYINLFKNVPNNERLEVISYSVGVDRLYYSAVRGTAVENGIVDINTNEYDPLTVSKKLTAIYTF